MRDIERLRYVFRSLCLSLALVFSGSIIGQGQEIETEPATKERVPASGRDPFKKYEPPRVIKKVNGQLVVPSIQERIAQYRAQKQAAMSARVSAPKATTALLISEIQVVGISRSPRGYAAIVEATPIKLSYVIYPGERFYDGLLVAIEESRLVFRREIVYSDGRRERAVELKPLRQQSSITVMNSARSTSSSPLVTESNGGLGDKSPTIEKP